MPLRHEAAADSPGRAADQSVADGCVLAGAAAVAVDRAEDGLAKAQVARQERSFRQIISLLVTNTARRVIFHVVERGPAQ
ncbi:hypothetical protein ACE1SV_71840 [Streptomyces sp. E-15]